MLDRLPRSRSQRGRAQRGVASVAATAGGALVTLDDVVLGPSAERVIEPDPLESELETEGDLEVVVTTTDRAGNTA